MKVFTVNKAMLCALACMLSSVESTLQAKILSEGPWLEPSKAFLVPEQAGSVRSSSCGWVEWCPSAVKRGKKAQLRIAFPHVKFRAFNQFYIEFDSENDEFEAELRLATARPKHGEIKKKGQIKSGKSSFEMHFPGVGSPARLREVKVIVDREALA